ncbi:MAG TPA: hypothetical protein RMH99_27825 [Sandaracinaceae bacterium LLY-WYZ-13_1]|nr:hypothetical protein [Sandaracinaceae bacterium LLY-WYZ-13_1]
MTLESTVPRTGGADPLAERLPEPQFPELWRAMRGARGDEFRRELLALIVERRPEPRAPRRSSEVMAQLELSDREEPEMVWLWDVSASGVRVTLPHGTPLDVEVAQRAVFVLQAQTEAGVRRVRIPAAFVRVAGSDPLGLQLAFRFVDPTAEQVRALRGLEDLFG